VGPFEEEEEGTGVASHVVKVEGEDPDTPGYLTFGPFSNPFGGRVSAVHDERAERTCSRNVLCSKM